MTSSHFPILPSSTPGRVFATSGKRPCFRGDPQGADRVPSRGAFFLPYLKSRWLTQFAAPEDGEARFGPCFPHSHLRQFVSTFHAKQGRSPSLVKSFYDFESCT